MGARPSISDRSTQSTWQMAQRKRVALISLVALTIVLLRWRPNPALADGAVISFLPAHAEVGMGETVDIQVQISNVSGLYAVEIFLSFDPTIVEVVDLDPDRDGVQVEKGQYPYPDYLQENEAVNAFGTIWYVVTQLSPREPANGSGTMLTVRFRGKSPGTTAVEVLQPLLSDSGGLQIAVDITQGEVVVLEPGVTPAQPTQTPSPVLTPTNTPSLTGATPTATPAQTLAAPTQTSAPVTSSPTATPAAPTATPTSGPYPYSYPTGTSAVEPTGSVTPLVKVSATPTPTFPTPASASPTPTLKGMVATRLPTAMPEPITATILMQPTAAAGKVAALIPTLEPPPIREVQQSEPEPLLPTEMFLCLVVFLVLFTVALAVYLVRRAEREA